MEIVPSVTAKPASRVFDLLRRVNGSRFVRLTTLLFVIAYAVSVLPDRTHDLFEYALEYHTRTDTTYGGLQHFYAIMHDRPMEKCSSFLADDKSLVERLRFSFAQIEQSTSSELVRMARFVPAYNRMVMQFYKAPPSSSCWSFYDDYVYLESSFSIDGPFLWLADRLNVSEIFPALLLMLGSCAGLVCLYLSGVRLSGSVLVGLLCVFSCRREFIMGQFSNWLILNVFVTVYLAQVLCERDALQLASRRATGVLRAGVATVFVFHGLLSYCIQPVHHRENFTIGVFVIALVAVAWRRWRQLALAGALWVAMFLATTPYRSWTAKVFSPMSNINAAFNEGFVPLHLFMGQFDRPNPYGHPNGDYAFQWAFDSDPLLRFNAFTLVPHQSIRSWGVRYLRDEVIHHPLLLPITWFQRVAIQMVYHRHLSGAMYRDWNDSVRLRYFWFMFAGTLLLALTPLVLLRPSLWPKALPVVLMTHWHLFGLNTLLKILHVGHVNYSWTGVVMAISYTPALVTMCVLDRDQLVVVPFRWCRRVAMRFGWRLVVPVMVAIAAAAIGLTGSVRRELASFWVWFPAHAGSTFPEYWVSPSDLQSRVERLIQFEDEPGAAEIYGAWAFWVYSYQNAVYRFGDATGDTARRSMYKGQAEALSVTYYRRALAAATDNPHFPVYAVMLNLPEWRDVFRVALARWPLSPYAAYEAYALATDPDCPPAEQSRYAALYEARTRELLEQTKDDRPFYVPTPRPVEFHGPSQMVNEGRWVHLQPGEQLKLSPMPTFNASSLKLVLYARSLRGMGTGEVTTPLPSGSGSCGGWYARPTDVFNYRIAECANLKDHDAMQLSIFAGPDGADLVIRDYYQWLFDPRLFRGGFKLRSSGPVAVPDLKLSLRDWLYLWRHQPKVAFHRLVG